MGSSSTHLPATSPSRSSSTRGCPHVSTRRSFADRAASGRWCAAALASRLRPSCRDFSRPTLGSAGGREQRCSSPAIRLARDGFPVGHDLAWALEQHLAHGGAGRGGEFDSLFYPDGVPLAGGSTLIQSDLAGTLETIRDVGAEAVRSGAHRGGDLRERGRLGGRAHPGRPRAGPRPRGTAGDRDLRRCDGLRAVTGRERRRHPLPGSRRDRSGHAGRQPRARVRGRDRRQPAARVDEAARGMPERPRVIPTRRISALRAPTATSPR